MDLKTTLTTFGLIFVAEMGDKTQLAAITMLCIECLDKAENAGKQIGEAMVEASEEVADATSDPVPSEEPDLPHPNTITPAQAEEIIHQHEAAKIQAETHNQPPAGGLGLF